MNLSSNPLLRRRLSRCLVTDARSVGRVGTNLTNLSQSCRDSGLVSYQPVMTISRRHRLRQAIIRHMAMIHTHGIRTLLHATPPWRITNGYVNVALAARLQVGSTKFIERPPPVPAAQATARSQTVCWRAHCFIHVQTKTCLKKP